MLVLNKCLLFFIEVHTVLLSFNHISELRLADALLGQLYAEMDYKYIYYLCTDLECDLGIIYIFCFSTLSSNKITYSS